MIVLTSDVVIRKTDKRQRSDIASFRASYADLGSQTSGNVALLASQNKTITSTKLLYMYFPKPTVILITFGVTVNTVTVTGSLLLPVACTVSVTNSSQATDPLTFTYVVA